MLYEQLTERIIGCEMEVHRQLGSGLPERVYRRASAIEFKHQGIVFVQEPPLPVFYRGVRVGNYYPDFIVDGVVVVEMKPSIVTIPSSRRRF
jgi:GxxExxY protein